MHAVYEWLVKAVGCMHDFGYAVLHLHRDLDYILFILKKHYVTKNRYKK